VQVWSPFATADVRRFAPTSLRSSSSFLDAMAGLRMMRAQSKRKRLVLVLGVSRGNGIPKAIALSCLSFCILNKV